MKNLFYLCVFFGLFSCNVDVSSSETHAGVEIVFIKPMSHGQVCLFLNKNGQENSVVQVSHLMRMGGVEVVGIVNMFQKDFTRYDAIVEDNVLAFQKDMMKDANTIESFKPGEKESNLQALSNFHTSIKDYMLIYEDKKITSLILEGINIDQKSIKGSEIVESVTTILKKSEITPVSENKNGGGVAFSPFVGIFYAGESQHGTDKRYIKNYFAFSAVPGTSITSPGSTIQNSNLGYEHDVFLNNSNNSLLGAGIYLDDSETPVSRIPIVDYAAAINMPSAYLDTRFMDGSNEVSFTIGSRNAQSINPYQWCMTYVRAGKGNANQDNAKLVAQSNHSHPHGTSCGSQWCMFSYFIEDLNTTCGGDTPWCTSLPGGEIWWNW